MKALEFEASVNPDRTLSIPPAVAAQLPPGQPVRVVLLVADSEEERDWSELTAAQFLKGYGEGDAIYDELPGG